MARPSRLVGLPHWETRDPEEATIILSEQQRSFHQEVARRDGYLLSANTAAMERLTFGSIWTPTPQEAWTEADGHYYLLMFWNQGWNEYRFEGRRQGRVTQEEGLLSTPFLGSHWKSKGNLDVVVASIPSAMLLRETQNLAGRPLPDPLEAAGTLAKKGPVWRLLNRFLRQLESGLFQNPSLLRRERQRQLVTFVAALTPHNIPFREERVHNIPPLHRLRYERAREYMEAHLTAAVSLGDIAAAAGVSERGLQRDFGFYHKTPLAELHALRMRAARRELRAPEETTTVSSVVMKYGLDPYRFPADYLALFGEQPHVTLQLARHGSRIY